MGDPATLRALPTIIRYFRDRGYTFVNLTGTTGTGYYVPASNGTVHSYDAPAAAGPVTGRPAGVATDPGTGGYWLLLSNGQVLGFHAATHGSLVGKLPSRATATAITGA